MLSGSVVLIALLCYTSLSAGSATLNVLCHSGLRSADIEVSMDGKAIYTDHVLTNHISTNPKKLFGLLGKRSETLSKSLIVSTGDHVLQVHVSSTTDKFDETAQREVKLAPGSESTLLVTAGRTGISLVYKPAISADAGNKSSYSALIRSVLVMVFGSAVSAAIGFVVMEFLRSKRTA